MDIEVLHKLSKEGDTELFIFDMRGDQEGPIQPNRHTFYELIILSQANGEIHTIDFEPYPMLSRSIFILSPGQVHQWEKGCKPKGKVLRFSEACFAKPCILHNFTLLSQDTPPHFIPDNTLFESTLTMLERIQKELQHNDALGQESATATLTLLLSDLERAFCAHYGNTSLYQSKLLEALLEFHNADAWKIQTVEHAAKVLGVSEDGLNREVKRCTGLSAGAFLRSKTILEAKRLLVYLNLPANSVGEKLGFFDAAYFSRFFKRETGISPSEFRQKYQ